ncbi:10.3 kDa protein [Fowl aviadenovirus 4]|uniref:10.3 kDa protein n=1 Tax=Fowl aviadenovirus 4 TaxID=130663 RepID=A0A173ADP2_FADV4|nr:10.3 kDa protein [Fowl aviadenovirus 4]
MMSNPSGYGQLKSLATVGLVLRSALERFPWTDYVSHLRDHVSTTYRKELPSSAELVEIELDTLTEILIDRLGQETAVLSAYKSLGRPYRTR